MRTMSASLEPTFVPTSLGRVAVHVLGAGRPTVLWHSMFVDGSSWGFLIPALLPGRRLLIVDGPGWGRSDRLRRTVRVTDSVTAAVEVLAALAPDAAVDWVGNGWGGHVGMELAATRPKLVRSLVAISAPTRPIDPALRRRIRLLVPMMLLLGPVAPVRRAILEGLLTDLSRTDPQTIGAVLDALALAGRRSTARTVRSFILNRVDITDLLPRIEAPTLFVVGDDRGDWSPAEAEAVAALAPFARAAVVAGSRTLLPVEQPAALASLIGGFWGSLETPAPDA
ncbi:MAG TPA: alpha/beta hydrolase [Amnibacterium sp.]|nr:alpha/beta hydrolase [Amnibacterium sp.]